jgi:hypothetical protein
MNDDLTPINARPKRRSPEALEDLSLALREHLLWPLQDRLLELGGAGRVLVAGGAAAIALGLGVGGYALVDSDPGGEQSVEPVAVIVEPTQRPEPPRPKPKPDPKPEPTLQGSQPVFKAPDKAAEADAATAKPGAVAPAAAGNTGNAATDPISSTPAARPAGASASASKVTAEGPPAGPAAIAVARKFAGAFVIYEIGGEESSVRRAFRATATPELVKALMRRPPRQPAGVEVPKAKVLNLVPAPSEGRVYPISVSLLRVGSTSELRLEMEQLKNKRWRVASVLG